MLKQCKPHFLKWMAIYHADIEFVLKRCQYFTVVAFNQSHAPTVLVPLLYTAVVFTNMNNMALLCFKNITAFIHVSIWWSGLTLAQNDCYDGRKYASALTRARIPSMVECYMHTIVVEPLHANDNVLSEYESSMFHPLEWPWVDSSM